MKSEKFYIYERMKKYGSEKKKNPSSAEEVLFVYFN